MDDSNPLHWSFDYNHGAQKPDFAQELIKLLHEHEVKSDTGDVNADTEHFKKARLSDFAEFLARL